MEEIVKFDITDAKGQVSFVSAKGGEFKVCVSRGNNILGDEMRFQLRIVPANLDAVPEQSVTRNESDELGRKVDALHRRTQVVTEMQKNILKKETEFNLDTMQKVQTFLYLVTVQIVVAFFLTAFQLFSFRKFLKVNNYI